MKNVALAGAVGTFLLAVAGTALAVTTTNVTESGCDGTGPSCRIHGANWTGGEAPTNSEPARQMKLDLGGGVKLEMLWIAPGRFMMGSPGTEAERQDNEVQHEVNFAKGFWMGKYEVTQAQWEHVMGNNPSLFKPVGKDAPVERVSWNDCQEFLKKLNEGVASSSLAKAAEDASVGKFRLPTEAEWEYACRAGTYTRFSSGDADANLEAMGWCNRNAESTTHPVGQKGPNPWGLHDMHGNVWEWCQDWYGEYVKGEGKDPVGPGSGVTRVLRGGAMCCGAGHCRAAYRFQTGPGLRLESVGLRLLWTAPGP